ncbi:uncharacterized protein LOC118419824 [Branchiostoma floridae]|uniref:RING-type E3 ubiquitin transferase n=3 Tax=Branchiostoma floridae TaxID=7739 RepID=A0A9J7LHE4_BRAFL|nr:uncharacterized protein LOC118419824 [Branchiostoma floridae]
MSQRGRSLSPHGASASAPQKPKNGKRKPNDDYDKRSILVSNIPPTLSDDKVMIHFQRTSSGGGDVRQVRRLSPSQAKVIFEDVEVIDRVVAKKHELDGVTLQVEAWSSFLARALEVDRTSHRESNCVQRATVKIHQPVSQHVWDSYEEKMLKTNNSLKGSRSTTNGTITLKGSWNEVVEARSIFFDSILSEVDEAESPSRLDSKRMGSRNGQHQTDESVANNLKNHHNASHTTPVDDSQQLQGAVNHGTENPDEGHPLDRVDLDRKQGEGASKTTPYKEKEQNSGACNHRSSSEMIKNGQKGDDDTVGFTRSQSLEPMEEDGLNEAMEYATLGSFRRSISAPGNASSAYGTSSIGPVGPQSYETHNSPSSLDPMELNSSKYSSGSKNQGMAGSGTAFSIPGNHKTKSSDPRMALGSEPMDQSGPPRDRTSTSSTYKLPEISAEERDEEAETIVDQTVDPDIMSYIIKVHSPEINMMARKHGVHFDHSKYNSTVYIKGSKRNAKAALDDFITLYQSLFSNLQSKSLDLCLHDLMAEECMNAVGLAQEHHPSVLISIKKRDGKVMFIGEEQEIRAARATICRLLNITESRRRRGNVSGTSSKNRPQLKWYNLSMPGRVLFQEKTTGVQIDIIKGDITSQKVDTIVNAANSSLSLAVGVSGAISRAGGRAIQTECDNIIKHGSLRTTDCVWTTPGRLSCTYIIHAVGPNFVPGCESRCKQELYDTCQKVLNIAASRLNAKSIAMPAISSGASGMPRRLCAEAMCSAIMDFVENGQGIGSSLLDIRIVDYDREAVKAFCDVFKAKIAKDSTSGATGQGTGFTSSGTGYTASGAGYTASGTGYTANGTGYTTIGPGYTTSGAAGYTTSVTTSYNTNVTTGNSTSWNMTPKYPPILPNYGSTSHIASSSITYPGPTQTYVTASSASYPHCKSTATSYPHSTPNYPRHGDLTQTQTSPGASATQPSQSHSTYWQTQPSNSRNTSSFSSPRASSASSASGSSDKEDTCPICLCDFTGPVTTTRCKHKFCSGCLDSALKVSGQCPVCKAVIGRLKGNQPPGTMTHRIDYLNPLPGYESYRSTIEIYYYFPDGVQGPEHPNPGKPYTGTSRRAYLPDNVEGNEVLRLLKRAFDSRLVFTIGTSATTGLTDTVVWNDIHHKTSKYGGPNSYGYPDPQYLTRVKEELAAKGIK